MLVAIDRALPSHQTRSGLCTDCDGWGVWRRSWTDSFSAETMSGPTLAWGRVRGGPAVSKAPAMQIPVMIAAAVVQNETEDCWRVCWRCRRRSARKTEVTTVRAG